MPSTKPGNSRLVYSTETGRIQEGHIAIGHALMELIEDGLIAREAIKRC